MKSNALYNAIYFNPLKWEKEGRSYVCDLGVEGYVIYPHPKFFLLTYSGPNCNPKLIGSFRRLKDAKAIAAILEWKTI